MLGHNTILNKLEGVKEANIIQGALRGQSNRAVTSRGTREFSFEFGLVGIGWY